MQSRLGKTVFGEKPFSRHSVKNSVFGTFTITKNALRLENFNFPDFCQVFGESCNISRFLQQILTILAEHKTSIVQF